jgi:hypothetical protein
MQSRACTDLSPPGTGNVQMGARNTAAGYQHGGSSLASSPSPAARRPHSYVVSAAGPSPIPSSSACMY